MRSESADEAVILEILRPEHPLVGDPARPEVFLGLWDGLPHFATDLSDLDALGTNSSQIGKFIDQSLQTHPELPQGSAFAELRGAMLQLSPHQAEIAATARALLEWHRTHRFCANCGAPSEVAMSGWQRDCPACGKSHYPRTDPVVIMLALSGNRVLLGRSPGWPEGMYSLLAGFVEPGETLESAARREIFEEAGVRLGEVRLLASQPWPFPASLMVGCLGFAETEDITVDPVEIEDAKWVSREEMVEILAGRHAKIRPARPGAIARALIEDWVAGRVGL